MDYFQEISLLVVFIFMLTIYLQLPKNIPKIKAWMGGHSWIVLRDRHLRRYETYLQYDKEGNFFFANVYPSTKTGHVILLPEGKISETSQDSYIESWQFVVNRYESHRMCISQHYESHKMCNQHEEIDR